jgi:hypothetical protein
MTESYPLQVPIAAKARGSNIAAAEEAITAAEYALVVAQRGETSALESLRVSQESFNQCSLITE